MARKSMQQTVEEEENQTSSHEQAMLIEVGPENLAQITPIAKEYKKVVTQRVSLNAREKELKEQLRALIHSSGLKRLADGSIRFKCDGMLVVVTPQDEKISIKEDKDEG